MTWVEPEAALGAGVAVGAVADPAPEAPVSDGPVPPDDPVLPEVVPPSATTPADPPVVAPIDWSGVLKPNSSRTTTTVPTNAVAARRGITIIVPSPA